VISLNGGSESGREGGIITFQELREPKRTKSYTPPEWLVKLKRQMSLIDVLYMAFSEGCECKVCVTIRNNMSLWERFFVPKEVK